MAVRPPIPELMEFLSVYDKDVVNLALATRRLVLAQGPKGSEKNLAGFGISGPAYHDQEPAGFESSLFAAFYSHGDTGGPCSGGSKQHL